MEGLARAFGCGKQRTKISLRLRTQLDQPKRPRFSTAPAPRSVGSPCDPIPGGLDILLPPPRQMHGKKTNGLRRSGLNYQFALT